MKVILYGLNSCVCVLGGSVECIVGGRTFQFTRKKDENLTTMVLYRLKSCVCPASVC